MQEILSLAYLSTLFIVLSHCFNKILSFCVVYREKLDNSVMFEEHLEMSSSKDTATLVTNDFTDH